MTNSELVIIENHKTIIPTMPENQFYVMDPHKGEDLVRGSQLRDGMIVLIEEHLTKTTLHDDSSDYDIVRFNENNFWCEIVEHRFHDGLVEFVGLYHDGVKRARCFNQSYYWIVKP